MVQQPWRAVWNFLKILKLEQLHDLAILLLGKLLEKAIIQDDTHTLMFMVALFQQPRHESNLNEHQQMNE